MKSTVVSLIIALAMVPAVFSCSVKKFAVKLVAGALSSGSSSVFSSDDDPQLVGDALPFALKLYETLLQETPDDPRLCLATGSAFIMYAAGFVDAGAEMLPSAEFAKKKDQLARAKKLYMRGYKYLMRGMEERHKGFGDSFTKGDIASIMLTMKREDVPFLYWICAAWVGAFSTDAFDIDMGTGRDRAVVLMNRALALDESYDGGAIHEFFISYYGTLPASMGGSEEKARMHFKKALQFSKGKKASPYVSLASSVCVKNQNLKEFTELLDRALAINPDEDPDNRLANLIAQKKARWLLDNKEDKFLIDKPEEKNESEDEGEGE